MFFGVTNAQITISAVETEGCAPLPVNIVVTSPAASTITSYQWTVTYPDNSISTSISSQYIDIFSTPGSYDISLTINGNQTTVFNDFLIVHAIPQVSFSVDDQSGCLPHCVQFTDNSLVTDGEIVSWDWDFGNGVISSDQNPSYCFSAAGNYTPILSVEDEFGCFNSTSSPGLISVSGNFPTANIGASNITDCNPPSLVNFSNLSSGSGIINSFWDFGDGFTQSLNGNAGSNHSFNALGDYDVCLTVTNTQECSSTFCTEVSIVAPPTPTFTVSSNTVCAGGVLFFTDTSTPPANAQSWDFDGDGVEDATGSTVAYAFDTPGQFNPVLTSIYSSNCLGFSLGDVTIDVLQALNNDFSGDDLVGCQTPFIVNFNNQSSGQSINGYEWLINGVSVSGDENLQYTFNGYGVYDVGLVVTTSTGCADTLNYADYITLAEPTINFNLPDVICTDQPVLVTNISIESVDAISTLLWDFNQDGIFDASGSNPNYSYTEPGEYNVEVAITTVSGCTNTVISETEILVQPNVVADFAASETITCAGIPVTFCTEMEESTIYAWNFDDNTGWQITSFPQDCIVHDYLDTGYFDVTLSVYNLACNALIHLENYIYIGGPVALFDFDQDCTSLDVVYFTDTSIDADSLVWDFGDGSPLVINDPTPSHVFPSLGTYTVTLYAYNFTTGCEDIRTTVVSTELPEIHLAAFPFQGCAPLSPNFSTLDYAQYPHWDVDFGNGTTLTADWNPLLNIWQVYTYWPDGQSSYSTFSFNSNWWPDVVYTQGGYYDITLNVVDESGCAYSSIKEDRIYVYNDQFFSDFDPVIIEGCDSVLIDFVPLGNFLDTWTWTFSDGTTSTELNPTHQFLPPWDYTFEATFTAEDNFGCSSTVTHVIDLVPPPVPDFTVLTNPNCIGDTIFIENNSTGSIAGYYWDFGDPASGADNLTSDIHPWHIFSQNGDYTICLTVENTQGCQQSLCQPGLVSIINPTASFDYQNQVNNCLFGVQFTNTSTGNLTCTNWDFGDEQGASSASPYHTYQIGVYDVELVVCNEFGCTDTLLVPDIFNYGNAIGPITISLDQTSCAPFQTTFDAYNVADNTFTYFWGFGDGFGDPNNNTQTSHTYTEPGEYCPSLIMEDGNGCPFFIQCIEPIVVTEFTFEATPISTYCFGDSVATTLSGADSYVLSDPTIAILNGNDVWISADQSTDLTITGSFDDCTYDLDIDVVVNQLPVVDVVLPELVCFDSDPIVLNTGIPNGGVYSVAGIIETTFETSMNPGVYEVIYEYTDQESCTNSDTTFVEIAALPLVTLSPQIDLCNGDPELIFTTGTPQGGSYSIDGQILTSLDPSSINGAVELVYTYADLNGCMSADSVDFNIWPQPTVSMSGSVLCWQPNVLLEAASSISSGSVVSYAWEINGQTATTTDPFFVFQPPGSGVYSTQLSAISDNGCTTSITAENEVHPTPTSEFTVQDICEVSGVEVSNSSFIDAPSITEWQWYIDETLFSLDENPEPLFNIGTGNYVIRLVTESSFGCIDTLDLPLAISPLPLIDFEVENPCSGASVFSINQTTISNGFVTAYLWDTGDGNTSSSEQLEYTFNNPGSYTISLTALSDEGCESVEAIDIEVYPLPNVAFEMSSNSTCENIDVLLTDNSQISSGEISGNIWLVDGVAAGQGFEFALDNIGPGQHSIGLVSISDQGCESATTSTTNLVVFPNPISGFSYSPNEVTTQTPIVTINDQSLGATSWMYTISDGGLYLNDEFSHEFSTPGEYEIWQFVTNQFGCVDSTLRLVDMQPALIVFVPNAFTPDGDGINEVFLPVISGTEVDEYLFRIYDRWGEVIFETDQLGKAWIGNVKGGDHYAKDGVYVYDIVVGSDTLKIREKYTGHVTLLR